MSNPDPTAPGREGLGHWISQERWVPYRDLAAASEVDPIALYVKNLNVSAALLRLVAIGEVVLRNAMDRQLEIRFGSEAPWPDSLDHLLGPRALKDVRVARRRARQSSSGATPGQVTAQLNLGFWAYLLSKQYKDSLWIPALRHVFPFLRPQVRDVAYKRARRMLELRNRIAHHEKVLARDFETEALAILELLSWIDPDVADWAAEVCRADIPGLRLEVPGRAT